MKKSSLISKKVLVTLVLGSMFCMSGALAKDVNVAAGQTINETVYGNDNTSISSGNTLNVTLGANSQVAQIIGGNGNMSSNNVVTISGNSTGKIVGLDDDLFEIDEAVIAGIGKIAANNNKIVFSGGYLDNDIVGGYAPEAKGNIIEIKGGGSDDDIIAASGFGVVGNNILGVVENNILKISGGNIESDHLGGSWVTETLTAKNNGVEITGGTLSSCPRKDITGVFGVGCGYSEISTTAVVENNYVSISGGIFNVLADKTLIIAGVLEDFEDDVADLYNTYKDNYVKITGGTFNADANGKLEIYGAKSTDGTVTGNKVEISNVTIPVNSVFGGFSEGKVSSNTLTLNGGRYYSHGNKLTKYAGGYSKGGESSNNKVILGDGDVLTKFFNKTWVIGGASITDENNSYGNVTGNIVTINDGTTFNSNEEYGAVTETVYMHIVGGRGNNGTISGNKVTINGAKIYDYHKVADENIGNNIWGGYVDGTGVVKQNSVTITDGEYHVGKIMGGYSENGSVAENTVTLTGVTVPVKGIVRINGGAVNTGNGTAYKNKVTINSGNFVETTNSDADVLRINGGVSVNGLASYNTVELLGGTFTDPDSGRINGGNSEGSTENNTVTIKNATLNVYHIAGGTSGNVGGSSANTVNIGTGANITANHIHGGEAEGTCIVQDNKVNITGGTITAKIMGGYSDSGNATYNIVNITGGIVTGNVYGGYSVSGNVTNNTVNITGGKIVGNVYGGYAGNGSGAFANTVELDNVTFAGNNKVYASGKNGVTDISATDGTITVGANGLVANGALELGATDVVLKGNITGAGAVTVKAFTLDTDKSVFLNSDLTVKDNNINIQNVSKELKLQFNGTEYTATQHKDIRTGLTSLGANTVLSFINGNLKLEANEVLAVAGTVSGNDMTLSGVQPTVYTKDSGDEIEKVGAQKNKTVSVFKEDTKELQAVTKVILNKNAGDIASNITAQDLQIKNVAGGEVLEIEVKDGSQLNLIGGDAGIVKNESGEAVKVSVSVDNDSAVSIGDIEGGTTGKKAEIGTLKVGGEVGVYNIGLNIDNLTMDGGTVVFDPAYIYVNELDFSAIGTVNVIADGTVVNVRMDKGELKAALDAAGLMTKATANNGYTVQDGKGVFAIRDVVLLNGGGKQIIVDKAGTTTDKVLQLGDGAVLVAKKAAGKEKIATINVDSKDVVKISDKAQLVVSAEQYQKDGEFLKYVVVGDGSDSFDDLWTEDNVFAADPTYKLVYKDGYLTADWNTVTGIYGDEIAAPTMYDRILQKESGSEANKFLKNVINATAGAGSTDATKAAGAAALNAVTSLGELAAVNHGLYTVSNQMTDAVANHLSIMDKEETGREVWAAYIHNKEDMDGMKLGGIEAKYDAKYNGVVVGADLVKSDKGTAGVALTYVDGDVSGTSGGVHTKNDAKYYGASVYGRIDNSNMALLGDISYMHSKGDITQYNSGVDITAKPKSDAFSVGVKAEWAVKIGESAKLVPFAGVRYMRLGTGDYENNLGMKYDVDNQNLILAPVGVAYSGNFEMGNKNWQFKPIVEFGYTFNMGDKNTDQKVSYNGYGDTFGMDIVDSGYWFGRVGFGFSNKRTEWLLGYQYMKSENTRNNKYMVHFSYKF